MNNAELPTTIIGLVSLAIITVGGIWRVRTAQTEQGTQVREVHAQVRNDHPDRPNMRDDMDDMSKMISSGFQSLRGDIRGIHKDISNLHGSVAGVRRELHTEIERSTAADSRLGTQVGNLWEKGMRE